MTDEDVQRNVRSSGEEGIETPKEKHSHYDKQERKFPFGESKQGLKKKKAKILEMFRQREKQWSEKVKDKEETEK